MGQSIYKYLYPAEITTHTCNITTESGKLPKITPVTIEIARPSEISNAYTCLVTKKDGKKTLDVYSHKRNKTSKLTNKRQYKLGDRSIAESKLIAITEDPVKNLYLLEKDQKWMNNYNHNAVWPTRECPICCLPEGEDCRCQDSD